ncbi:hypothetical protein DB88DRAFT_546645 [Papiliotrema laurentii]|uniref:Uncharacterized protein n=1 Tax=Papiliotrema laurentii TaxID=5418 RepID=A0AAD9FPZ0_PAPLA|nr:hypothetical protein DB88DRAFT_546645 [Papiliotrema laurentii]
MASHAIVAAHVGQVWHPQRRQGETTPLCGCYHAETQDERSDSLAMHLAGTPLPWPDMGTQLLHSVLDEDDLCPTPPMHTDDAERPVHFWLLLRGYVFRNETLGFVSIAITFGQPRKDVGSKRDMLHYRANLQCISCSNVIHEAGTSTDAPWLEAETGLDRLDDIGPLLVPVRTFLGARRTAPGGVPHHRPCILRGPLCTACLRVMGTIRRTLFGPNELGRLREARGCGCSPSDLTGRLVVKRRLQNVGRRLKTAHLKQSPQYQHRHVAYPAEAASGIRDTSHPDQLA